MSWIGSRRSEITWALICLSLLVVFAQTPAMRHLGYPLSVMTSALSVVFGLITARSPLSAWRGYALAWVLFALVAESIWGCDTLSGLAWTVLGPLTGAALGLGIGRTLQGRLGLAGWRYALAGCALIALDLAALGWRMYDQPQVMVLDPLLGYIHGPIYDDWVPIEGPVILGRLLALSSAVAWLLFSRARGSRGVNMAWLALGCFGLGYDALPTRTDLNDALSRTHTGRGIIVRAAPDQDRQAQRIVREAEAHIAHLSELTLGTSLPPAPVTVWLYPNADTKKRLMGAGHVLIARPWQNEIHLHPTRSPDPHLRHELVHALLAHQSDNFLGVPLTPLPNPALVEGMAVFLAPGDGRLSVHQAAAALHRRGRLPSIDALLGLRFSLQQGRTAYRAAGSLMQFIAEEHGLERLLKAYHGGSLAAAGFDEQELAQAWLRKLEGTVEPSHARRNLLRSYAHTPLLKRACPNEVQAAWRHAQRRGERSDQEIESDYRAVMALSGDCRPLGSFADHLHRKGLPKARRAIEDEMIQRGIPSTLAASLYERRADEAISQGDWARAKDHLKRALAAAPAEHRYRGLLVRALTLDHRRSVTLLAPYLTSGANAKAVREGLIKAYDQLPTQAAAAVAYLLMRYYGNRGEVAATELWGLRAQPLPPTLAKETEHYLAQQAERLKKPCLAARRWRSLSQHHVAVRDRLGEHLARLRFHYPEATCVVLASPQTP